MSDTALAMASFPSRAAGDAAIVRLVSEGFARNSMELDRTRDGYRLTIHTRASNYDRVQRLLAEQPGVLASAVAIGSMAAETMIEAARGELVQQAVETAGGLAVAAAKAHPVLALGGAVIAGVALYKLLGGRMPAMGPLRGFTVPRGRSAQRRSRPQRRF
jgi:hypothetical protein